MVVTIYNSSYDMIDKIQELKGKTRLKYYETVSDYYGERKH